MHSEYTPHAIAAGFASAAILVLFSLLGFNLLLSIFCIIPVLYVGISKSLQAAALSVMIASFILLGFSSHLLIIYLVVMAIPALLFLASMMANRPMIDTFSELVLYAITLCSLIHIRLKDSGGIQGVMSDAFNKNALDQIDPAIVEQLAWMMQEASFIFIALAVCATCILFYASAWMVAALLKKKHMDIDPFLVMDQENPPIWVLGSLIIFAILSMLGGDMLSYISKLNFVIILLPYVFSGAMYTPLRKWRGMQSGWAVSVYAVAFMLTWPAVFFAGLGVVKHAEAILKK